MNGRVLKCDLCGTITEGGDDEFGWISISPNSGYGMTISKLVKKGLRAIQEVEKSNGLHFCSGTCFSKYFTEI